jgi:hypothetical protein
MVTTLQVEKPPKAKPQHPSLSKMQAAAKRVGAELIDLIPQSSQSFGELLVACRPDLSTDGLRDNDPEIDRRLDAQNEIRDALMRSVGSAIARVVGELLYDAALELVSPAISEEAKRGIRRFYLEPKPSYAPSELSAMWGIREGVPGQYIRGLVDHVALEDDHGQISREDALMILAAHVVSYRQLEEILGVDFDRFFSSECHTEPTAVHLPRYYLRFCRRFQRQDDRESYARRDLGFVMAYNIDVDN